MTRSASSPSARSSCPPTPASHGRARPLRAAGGLGRPLRGRDPAADPAQRRPADRRPQRGVAGSPTAGALSLQHVRSEARDAIAGYLRKLIGLALLGSLTIGLLVAFAVRHRAGPRLRYTVAAVPDHDRRHRRRARRPLPPARRRSTSPQYYAFGPDIPRALDAVEAAQRSTSALDQELDAQLVGLARLVTDPAGLTPLTDRPSITIASDLHNNFLAEPILESATGKNPLFFAGDLTDRGSPLEAQVVSRVTNLGDPFVFVSGNHDSDSLQLDLARRGAIVLTERGQLKPDGTLRRRDRRRQGPQGRRLPRPVRAPRERELQGPLPAVPHARPAGRLHRLADAADRQGRRRDGPRAGADRARAGDPRGRPARPPAGDHHRPHARGRPRPLRRA